MTSTTRSTSTLHDNWRLVRLDEVAQVNPRRPKLSLDPETPVTFLPMAAISEDCSGIVTRLQRPYREIAKGYTYFQKNDILFAKITPCLQNGKHAIATGLHNGFGFGTTEFHVLRARACIDPRHLFRVVTQAVNIEKFANSFTGTAGQQRIQPEALKSLRFHLPPLTEQRAIAKVLDAIDDAIERMNGVIAATERLREALLHELLMKGLSGWHTEWREHPNRGTVPDSWQRVRLGDVLTLEYGKSLPMRRRRTGPIPVVGSAGVIGQHDSAVVQGPGIVIGRKGSIGSVTWINDDFVPIDTTYYVVHSVDRLDLGYAFRLLAYENLSKLNRATGVPGLNRDDVYALRTLLPPLPEQQAIAQVLDGVDSAIEETDREKATLTAFKESVSDALLTGRVRVPIHVMEAR